MKIAVMGTGGVGGYFGARLAAAGNDVTFIARGRHLDAIRANGLRLDSVIGALTLQPAKVVASAAEIGSADAIVFAVKLGDTEPAAESLKPLVAKGASVFTFQNGVDSFDRLSKVLGAKAIVPGVARVAAHISEPGVVKEAGRFATLEIGEADGSKSQRTQAFHDMVKAAGVDVHLRDNINRALWLKFAMLAPCSGLTSLVRGPIGPVRRTPESRALLFDAVREVVALGTHLKMGLEPGDADTVIKQIEKLPDTMMSSMSHDLVAGKPIEIFGLSGTAARLGREHGVAMPVHTFITAVLAPFAKGPPAP